MAKKIDLNRTVFELTQEYPELIDILAGLGFTEITKKPMLHSAGKIMTIPKGAKIKKIPMIKVVKALLDNGFILAGEMPEEFVMIGYRDGTQRSVCDFLSCLTDRYATRKFQELFVPSSFPAF